MKKLLIAILFLLGSATFADSLDVLYGSMFYTNGDYNTNNHSNSYAGYLSIGKDKFTTTLSYEGLSISNNLWRYYQQFGVIGETFNFYPFFIKANYGHIKGDLIDRYYGFLNSDYLNLYNAELVYTDYFTGYFGLSYTHQNLNGFNKRAIDQYVLRFERYLTYNTYISIRPAYTSVNDGRKMYSISAKLNWYLAPFLLKIGGSIGQRAYYFDNDLLTIYNQDQTQKNMLSIQCEYPLQSISLVVSYQHTDFNDYKINYYIAGIKTNFLALF